jgi:hypothetical protein
MHCWAAQVAFNTEVPEAAEKRPGIYLVDVAGFALHEVH